MSFNQEKALVGAFYVIVQPVVEPMDRFTALTLSVPGTTIALLCRLSMVNCPGPLHPSNPVPGQAAPYRV